MLSRCGPCPTMTRSIRRYKLITIDEVGYIPFDQDAANLFFQLIASRYEQGSVMETSNLPSDAGETFSDDVVAAAMIDRLVHHAEVLTLTGDSYRTRQRRDLLNKGGGLDGGDPAVVSEEYEERGVGSFVGGR
ncbi:ATP-binding protein [Streptomyces sp. NPDC055815]